ncbi:Hypothetical protein POVR2_LOCUS351 [uncultured virus]|nr:Hypothetical protein POVR2_LOCUS351 [uncultured virus]
MDPILPDASMSVGARANPADIAIAIYEISVYLPVETLEVLALSEFWPSVKNALQDRAWSIRRSENLQWFEKTKQLLVDSGYDTIPVKYDIVDWYAVFLGLKKSKFYYRPELDYTNLTLIRILLATMVASLRQHEIARGREYAVRDGSIEVIKLLMDARYPVDNPIVMWRIAESRGDADIKQLLLTYPDIAAASERLTRSELLAKRRRLMR